MSDDAVLATLDRRGDRAGAARSALAGRLPVPAFDPSVVQVAGPDGSADPAGPARAPRRWLAVAGVAAAVAVLVAAIAVLAARGEDDSAPADRVRTGDPDLGVYVLDPPPEGLPLAAIGEPRSPDVVGRGGPPPLDQAGPTAVLYGAEAGGRPGLAAVALRPQGVGIDTGEPGPDTPPESIGLEPIEVPGGRRAWATPAADLGPARVVVEVEDGIAGVYRAADPRQGDGTGAQSSAQVDDVLLEAAAAVGVDGERAVIDPSGLPTGWVEQGEVDTAAVRGSTADVGMQVRGPVGVGTASYGSVRDPESAPLTSFEDRRPGIVVSVRPGGQRDVDARRFWARTYAETEVRGHPAVVVTTRSDGEVPAPDVTVSWREAPGVIVAVAAVGLGAVEVLALAERVRPANRTEVRAARDAALDEQLARVDPEQVVLGRGRFADGLAWGLVAHGGEGIVEGAVLLAPGPYATWGCGEVADEGTVVGPTCRGRAGDVPAGFGRVRTDVAEVALVQLVDGGSTEVDRVAVLAAGGMAGFVVELPDGDERYRVVAYAADGTELGSRRLGA